MERYKRKGTMVRWMAMALIPLAVTFFVVPYAIAHRVYLFAWVEGDLVCTESYYSGNRAVRGGEVRVLDLRGRELLRGKTDEEGRFSFPLPGKQTLRILLEEATGHRAEYVLKTEEMTQTEESPKVENQEDGPVVPKQAESIPELDQIRKVVEEVLDTRLKPLQRSIARMEQERGPSLSDIFAGLGYIFGLMGIVVYIKSRKKGGSTGQDDR